MSRKRATVVLTKRQAELVWYALNYQTTVLGVGEGDGPLPADARVMDAARDAIAAALDGRPPGTGGGTP